MSSLNFITVRLGKDSLPSIKKISSSEVGVLTNTFTINVRCTQIPENYKTGDYAFIWLGSDNNKGMPTKWKQGFKALGRVNSIVRGKSYNDASETVIEIAYVFQDAINRLDILRSAPVAYYWCSSLPLIGIDDHANQTIRSMVNNSFSDLRAFFTALESVSNSFRNDIVKIESKFNNYFDFHLPNPQKYPFAKNLDELHLDDTTKPIDNPLQQIFYGAPGTGKSHRIKEIIQGNGIDEKARVIRTTFHPDSDYSTFVGAYKPTTIEVPMRDVTGKIIVENGKQVSENRIVYEFVEQAFLQAYIKAWNLYAKTEEGKAADEVFLIIEEINRGNCAQIFGDLFQLLDRGDDGFSEYPILADCDLQKQLAKAFADISSLNIPAICDMNAEVVSEKIKKGEILLLPNNLYIWATMNTSDQSLFPIDSAFKRRWDWKYIPIADAKKNYVIEVDSDQYDWWSFLEIINKQIEDSTRSEDKKLGYFFAKANDGKIATDTFVSKVIFYLWNDVFKDNESEHKAFKNENGEMLAFREFFHQDGSINTNTVIKFLQDLEVDPFENSDNSAAQSSSTIPNAKRARDKSRYRVNTTDNLNKAQMTREALRTYIESHPDADANSIVQAWNGLGLKGIVQHLVETEKEFIERTKDSQDPNKRAVEFILANDEKIYLSTQFGIGNIDKFIDAINKAGWNIRIDKTA